MRRQGLVALICAQLLLYGCGDREAASPVAQCSPAPIGVHPQSFSLRYTRFLVQTGDTELLSTRLQSSGETVSKYRVAKFSVDVKPLSEGWQIVDLKGGDRSALIETLLKTPGVTSIEPDFEIETGAKVEQNSVPEQWAHIKVDSRQAWSLTQGHRDIVVAVVDGGVDIDHPDLATNVFSNPNEVEDGRDDDGNGYVDDIHGWDFVNEDANPRSDSSTHFHGSHVAGTIGALANRARMLIGHAPQVRILPLKFINAQGTGNSSHAIRAIDYAIRMKADIINASWSSTNYSSAMYQAIARAQKAGILFVAAAGNVGRNNDLNPHYPANYGLSNIISVGASTTQDTLASFSDYGKVSVDFVAPGSSIYSLKNNGGYATMSGTSMATPLVSGIAVLIKAKNPSFSYAQIAQSLFMGVDKISSLSGKVKYAGRINAYKAVTASEQVRLGKGLELEADEPDTGICGS